MSRKQPLFVPPTPITIALVCKMGHDLSRIVDTLYPLPTNQRLAALDQLLQDKNVSVDSIERKVFS
jgi:hypothetical protein